MMGCLPEQSLQSLPDEKKMPFFCDFQLESTHVISNQLCLPILHCGFVFAAGDVHAGHLWAM